MGQPLPDFSNQFTALLTNRFVFETRAPTTQDSQYALGTGWFDSSGRMFYMLMGFDNQLADWVDLTPAPPPPNPNLGIKYFENIVLASTIDIVPNTCYRISAGALVTLNLPLAITAGNEFQIIGLVGGWSIAQSGAQQIIFDAISMGPGVGSISSQLQTNGVTIRCIEDNELFAVVSSIGNLTVI